LWILRGLDGQEPSADLSMRRHFLLDHLEQAPVERVARRIVIDLLDLVLQAHLVLAIALSLRLWVDERFGNLGTRPPHARVADFRLAQHLLNLDALLCCRVFRRGLFFGARDLDQLLPIACL
jgi:hypothetical protein